MTLNEVWTLINIWNSVHATEWLLSFQPGLFFSLRVKLSVTRHKKNKKSDRSYQGQNRIWRFFSLFFDVLEILWDSVWARSHPNFTQWTFTSHYIAGPLPKYHHAYKTCRKLCVNHTGIINGSKNKQSLKSFNRIKQEVFPHFIWIL